MTFAPADVNEEYVKDANLKKEDVQKLIEWAEKQPHLPKITELQFVLFLQSCYYNNELAKQALDNYFTIRTICPDIFRNRNPFDSNMLMAIDTGLIALLPQKSKQGNQILYSRLYDPNPDKYVYLDQTKLFDMLIMPFMHSKGTCEGFTMLFDADGMSFTHLLKINPTVQKKYLYYLQEAMPIRLKDFHIINAPTFMDKILALVRPMMKKELYDMIFIHPNLESLYKHVPKECLPEEYGGNAGSLKKLHDDMKTMVESNVEYFKNEGNQLVDESKRAQKSKNIEDIYGMEGTFKKLEVD